MRAGSVRNEEASDAAICSLSTVKVSPALQALQLVILIFQLTVDTRTNRRLSNQIEKTVMLHTNESILQVNLVLRLLQFLCY